MSHTILRGVAIGSLLVALAGSVAVLLQLTAGFVLVRVLASLVAQTLG